MDILHVIDDLYQIHDNGVKETFVLLLTEDAVFIINTSRDYSKKVAAAFSDIGEVLDFVSGGLTGMLSSLASETVGKKLGKTLKYFAQKKADKQTDRIINNLEKIARKGGKEIQKYTIQDIQHIRIKKKHLFTKTNTISIQHKDVLLSFRMDKMEDLKVFKQKIGQHYPYLLA